MSRWQQIDFRYSTNVEMGYSAVPFVRSIIGEVITILFSNRDNMGKSFLQEVKLRIKTDDSIEVIEDKGVVLLEAGNEGAFDSAGTMACQLARIQNKNYLYYIGWNIGNDVPFRNSIGVAEENEDGSFKKLFDGPIVDRSIYDPCFVASMNVIPFKNRYLMYYLSCVEWVKTDGGLRHKYHIKIAESKDGLDWKREGKIAIDFKDADEYAISVPRVKFENGIYKMWYSYRGSELNESYRIGYAESNDALKWVRYDSSFEIRSLLCDWDSEMQCYPYVFNFKEDTYILYNGNGYGKTGFGVLKLLRDEN